MLRPFFLRLSEGRKVKEKAEEPEEVIYRICTVCKESKPLTEFYRDKTKKLGRRGICKKCHAIKDKKRYELNRERKLKQRKQYYYEHKEQIFKQSKIYYLKHKEQIAVRKRKYRQDHKEEIAKQEKKYHLERKQKASARNKRYRQSERGGFLKKQNNRRRRVRQRASKRDLTFDQWHRILKNQKYRCNICSKRFCKSRPATMDHIIPLSQGGDFTSSNVQALCQSCNSSKNAKILKGFINSWCL